MTGNTTGKTREHVHDDFETLREDFGRLRDDVQTLMKDTATLGKHGGQHVADTARQRSEQIADKVRDGAATVESTVTTHPLAALGVAVGVGLLAGMILRR